MVEAGTKKVELKYGLSLVSKNMHQIFYIKIIDEDTNDFLFSTSVIFLINIKGHFLYSYN